MTASSGARARTRVAIAGDAISSLARSAARRPALVIIPLGMIAVGVAGRYQLGTKSLWFDEAFAITVAAQDWPTLWRTLWGPNIAGNMLAYHVLQHFWLSLGSSEGVFRSLSVVFAVATVPPLYALTARLFDNWAAGAAVLLLAVNAFFVQYAQEARSYAALAFMAVLSSLLLLRALDHPTRLRWAMYTAAAILAVYTHYFATLLLLAHLVAILVRRPRASLRTVVATFGAIGVAGLPLLNAALAQGLGFAWVPPLSVDYALDVLQRLIGGSSDGELPAAGFAVVCGSGILLTLARRRWRWEWSYAALLAIGPICAALALSLARPSFVSRYLIVALPGMIVVAGASLSVLRPRRLGAGGVIALMLLAGWSLQGWYTGVPKEDWRAAVQYVSTHAHRGDWLIAYPSFTRLPIDYYLGRQPVDAGIRPLFPTPDWGDYFPGDHEGSGFSDAISRISGSRERVWVMYRYIPPDPETSDGKALALVTQGKPFVKRMRFALVEVRLYEFARTSLPVHIGR